MLIPTHHLAAYVEGVIAIAACIGIDSLASIEGEDLHAFKHLINQKSSAYGFAVAVFGIIVVWRRAQIEVTQYIAFVDDTLISLTLLDLGLLCLVPFNIISLHSQQSSRAAAGSLPIVLILLYVNQQIILWYANKKGLWREPLRDRHSSTLKSLSVSEGQGAPIESSTPSDYAAVGRAELPSAAVAFSHIRVKNILQIAYLGICTMVISVVGTPATYMLFGLLIWPALVSRLPFDVFTP